MISRIFAIIAKSFLNRKQSTLTRFFRCIKFKDSIITTLMIIKIDSLFCIKFITFTSTLSIFESFEIMLRNICDFEYCYFYHFENRIYHDFFNLFIISCLIMNDLYFCVDIVHTNDNDILKFIIFQNTILNALS